MNAKLETELVRAEAEATTQYQAAVTIAQTRPRDEEKACADFLRECKEIEFAEEAQWSYPRGGEMVRGPSVVFARAFARCWRNLWLDCRVIHDDPDSRTVRVNVIDLERNLPKSKDVHFAKLIEKWVSGNKTLATPNERELIELNNRQVSKMERNLTLDLLPQYMITRALKACDARVLEWTKTDPEAAKAKIVAAFERIGVNVPQIEIPFGKKLGQLTDDDIMELRTVFIGIRDGAYSWQEWAAAWQSTRLQREGASAQEPARANPAGVGGRATGKLNVDDLKAGAVAEDVVVRPEQNPAGPEQNPAATTSLPDQPPDSCRMCGRTRQEHAGQAHAFMEIEVAAPEAKISADQQADLWAMADSFHVQPEKMRSIVKQLCGYQTVSSLKNKHLAAFIAAIRAAGKES